MRGEKKIRKDRNELYVPPFPPILRGSDYTEATAVVPEFPHLRNMHGIPNAAGLSHCEDFLSPVTRHGRKSNGIAIGDNAPRLAPLQSEGVPLGKLPRAKVTRTKKKLLRCPSLSVIDAIFQSDYCWNSHTSKLPPSKLASSSGVLSRAISN